MTLDSAQVSNLETAIANNQVSVQARVPVTLTVQAVDNQCIGFQILTAIQAQAPAVRQSDWGPTAPDLPLESKQDAWWYLSKINSLVFRAAGGADVVYKRGLQSDTVVTLPVLTAGVDINEPFAQMWRCYFAFSGNTEITLAVG